MTKVKIVVTVGFLVAFAAGLVLGFESYQRTVQTPSHQDRRSGWLTNELNLTSEQQEKIKKIWSEMPWRGGHEREDQHRVLREKRDKNIAALIRPEDKARYDQILKDYTDKMNALDRELHNAYQIAVEKTKQVLEPEQRVTYEKVIQRHQWERGNRDRHRGEREREMGRSGERHPASRPAPQS